MLWTSQVQVSAVLTREDLATGGCFMLALNPTVRIPIKQLPFSLRSMAQAGAVLMRKDLAMAGGPSALMAAPS